MWNANRNPPEILIDPIPVPVAENASGYQLWKGHDELRGEKHVVRYPGGNEQVMGLDDAVRLLRKVS